MTEVMDIKKLRQPAFLVTVVVFEGDINMDLFTEPNRSMSSVGHLDGSEKHEGHEAAACIAPQVASVALQMACELLGVTPDMLRDAIRAES